MFSAEGFYFFFANLANFFFAGSVVDDTRTHGNACRSVSVPRVLLVVSASINADHYIFHRTRVF